MSTSTPKVALGWILPFRGAVFGYILWAAWSNDVTYGLMTSALCLALLIPALPHLSTAFNNDGISQLTWRGRKHLQWHEVRQAVIETEPFPTVHLKGDTGTRIKVNSIFYNDFESTLEWLRGSAPQKLDGFDRSAL